MSERDLVGVTEHDGGLADQRPWRPPPATAHQSRLQLFQPSRRPTYHSARAIETPWGAAAITGRLGQSHADVLEAICATALEHCWVGERLHLRVDPYRVRRVASGGRLHSHQQLWLLMRDLRAATIDMTIRRGEAIHLRVAGGIIDEVRVRSAAGAGAFARGAPRALWRVILSAAFSALMAHDLRVAMDTYLLARLRSGISAAIARHILGHRWPPQGGWVLDRMIATVGADGALRDSRRAVREDAAGLRALGIHLEGGRLHLEPRPPLAQRKPSQG